MPIYPFKKILVSLDLSQKDEATIQCAAKIAELSTSSRVEFIYVAKSSDLPEEIKQLHINEMTQYTLLTVLQQSVSDHFDFKDAEINFHIQIGNPLDHVLEKAEQMSADIIIAGKGNLSDSAAVFPEKLARRANCSVLVVPKSSGLNIKRVVVPIDYSAYSKNALKVAIDLVKHLGSDEITLLRADPLPVPYMITGAGWSYEKFCRDVRAIAESKLANFIEPLNFKKISTKQLFLVDSSAGQAILTAIQNHQFDLCIIGAKGKSALTAFFLGSTAEEVLRGAKIPVLIVRPKDEN